MLVSQQCGGHENNHLFTTGDNGKGGAHGDLCFAETNVATDQTIHGLSAQ